MNRTSRNHTCPYCNTLSEGNPVCPKCGNVFRKDREKSS
ncbi:MAG: hypothetical protein MUO94_01880 [Thermoplasmata archaeon]|nr:hypothetical protein [Thermoplasmata archaeon]